MAIIFLGEVEYQLDGKMHRKEKNQLILNECFYKT
jgi:hypothetical protein